MKLVSRYLLVFCLFLSFGGKAQLTMHKILNIGYTYQNQSFGEIGGKLLFLSNDEILYRIGAGALIGVANNKFSIMPKVQGDILMNFEKGSRDFYHSWYFLGGAELTNKYIAPKIGFNIFGVLDITGGYAFSFDKKGVHGKELKGLNLGVTLNLPIPFIASFIKK